MQYPCSTNSSGARPAREKPKLSRGDEIFLDMCRTAAHYMRCQRFIALSKIEQAVSESSASSLTGPYQVVDNACAEILRLVVYLLRLLQFGSGKGLRLHRVGSTDLSFDEAWLISLGKAVRQDDRDSVSFLLSSRLTDANAKRIRALCLVLLSHIQNYQGNVRFAA